MSNSKDRHPLFAILKYLAGYGWTFSDVFVSELPPDGESRIFRLTSLLDSADFVCKGGKCEATSETVDWTRNRSLETQELDRLRCMALEVALERYLTETALLGATLPTRFTFGLTWTLDRGEDGAYFVSIGPQESICGGDVTDWLFVVKPNLEVILGHHQDH